MKRSNKPKKLTNAKARRAAKRIRRFGPRVNHLGASMVIRGANPNTAVMSFSRRDTPVPVVDSQIVDNATTVAAGSSDNAVAILLSPSQFARMVNMAGTYDLVRLEKLSVTFMPYFGTSVPGMINMYFDYNDAPTPAQIPFQQAILASGSVTGPIYKPLTLHWRPQDHGDREFGPSNSLTSFRTDNKLTGFHVSIKLPSISPSNFGLLVFRYRATFKSLKAVVTGSSVTNSNDATLVARLSSLPIPTTITPEHMNDTIQALISSK